MREAPYEFGDLLAQTRWVRSLAHALVRDPHVADDIAQDSLLVALDGRAKPTDFRQWVRGVVRNSARRYWRTTERRQQREREVASARTTAESADELVEKAELQRVVIEHVTALAEPYRSTLLLRFFEELSYHEIGRQQGVPASTARTRTSRGLEQLRERFDRKHGGRSAWIALLMPLSSEGSALALEGLVVGMKTKVVLAGAALLAAVALLDPLDLRSSALRSEATRPVAVVDDLRVVDPSGAQELAEAPRGEARTPMELAPATPPAADLGVLLFGSILGEDGSRVAAGSLQFEAASVGARTASLGAAGSYSIVGLQPGAWSASAVCAGYYPQRVEFDVLAGEPEQRHDFVLTPAIKLDIRFVTPDGVSLEDALAAPDIPQLTYPVAIATVAAPPRQLPGVFTRDASMYGVGWYRRRGYGQDLPGVPLDVTGQLELQQAPPVHVSAVFRNVVLDTVQYTGGPEEVTFVIESDAVRQLLASARVRVVDALTGEPVTRGSANLSSTQGGGSRESLDENGEARMSAVFPGVQGLQVYAEGYEFHRRFVRVVPGSDSDLGTVELSPSVSIRGQVVDPDGEPAAVHFTWVPFEDVRMLQDAQVRYALQSDVDGRFEVEAIGRRQVFLVVSDPAWAPSPVLVDARGGDVDGVELRLQKGQPVTIRGERVGRDGCEVAVADAQGRVFWSNWILNHYPARLRLVPGAYEVWVQQDEERVHAQSFTVADSPVAIELPSIEAPR